MVLVSVGKHKNVYLGYAVLGVPLLWIIYLAIVNPSGIEGSIAIIIFASIFVTLAAGAIPALFLGSITGTIQAYVLLRKPAGFSQRRFILLNLGVALLAMLIINVMAGFTFLDFPDLAGLGFDELLNKIFPLLLAVVFPGLVYVAAATWLGSKLYRESRNTMQSYRGR